MSGFLVVGVGPGDPELMTVRAVRAIAEADVVAYPVSARGSLAARIAEPYLTNAERLPFNVPMTGDGAAESAYAEAAEAIAAHLSAGRRVALLCEGDPMLYGSAASVAARLADRFAATVVPGVTAASASAARANISIARGDEPLAIVPATGPQRVLDAALAGPGAVVIYKVGRHFDRVAARVRAAGREGTLITRATLPEETVAPIAGAAPGPKPYFSTILVPAGRPAPPRPANAVAIVVLSPEGIAAAHTAKAALVDAGRRAEVHGYAKRLRADEVDVPFANVTEHVAALFLSGAPVVGLAAAGILIRAVAPFVFDKREEPAVIALAEDGSAVVPLLGAHRGGAQLARTLGAAFAVRPALTTASEVRRGHAFDDPAPGFVVADPAPFKALAASEAPAPPRTTHEITPDAATVPTLIARRIALGMGAERGAAPGAAIALAEDTLRKDGIETRAVSVVVSLDKKADEAALHAVADHLGASFRVFDAATLGAESARLATPSETVRAAVGVPGVAEAAALAAAGPGGTLLVPKIVSGQFTVAIAAAPEPIAPDVGRARGHLAVVGTGPGAHGWRTREALGLFAQADEFVGYTLYLDLVEDLRAGRPRHDFPLGAEEKRVRFALERAGKGRSVALVSSGDPGIYAMATLALELLESGDISDAARRVALTVAPGISAAQAAAARAGAPLGHDFAFISLSDLMTPWPAIRRRLEAAAQADFAVALYNPRSQRRTEQLGEALAIFAAHRPSETPVIVAESVGRPAERLHHTTLAALEPESVHMLATVIVGASSTRRFTRGDGAILTYTPRGYEVA